MDDAARGAQALTSSDFLSAIKHFTRALTINPQATDYYIKRSTAYLRLRAEDGGPDDKAALRDAEMAVVIATQRARRELIISGQMRRAIVLYHQGRFGDADFLFKLLRGKLGSANDSISKEKTLASAGIGDLPSSLKQAGNKNQELQIWELKVKAQLGKLAAGDETANVTIKELPEVVVPPIEDLKKIHLARLHELEGGVQTTTPPASEASRSADDSNEQEATTTTLDHTPSANTEPTPTISNISPLSAPCSQNYRHEWYQNPQTVVVTLYAKGVNRDSAEIDIQEHSLSITFPRSDGTDFQFNLDPLFDSVDTTASKATIMSTKIEVSLRKKNPGQKWSALEAPSGSARESAISITQPAPAQASAPLYPTSARGGAKNWDKVAADLSKDKGSGKAKDGAKDEGDEDLEEYNSGDPVDAFFKKLYAHSDEDTRRAMVKSYYESKGTALSTNWSEVSKGPVQPHADSDDNAN